MSYGLGVDFGTTFTAAAVFAGGRAETVGLGLRANAVPTVVYVGGDGLLCGEPAEVVGASDPGRLIREFKRQIGDEVPYRVGGVDLTMEMLVGAMLGVVVDRVSELRGGRPDSVTLTCPATWEGHRRDVLANAAIAAGIVGAGLLTEPEAAAIYYAAEERLVDGDVIGVFDFGGGTFDASVLRKSVAGSSFWGGRWGMTSWVVSISITSCWVWWRRRWVSRGCRWIVPIRV